MRVDGLSGGSEGTVRFALLYLAEHGMGISCPAPTLLLVVWGTLRLCRSMMRSAYLFVS